MLNQPHIPCQTHFMAHTMPSHLHGTYDSRSPWLVAGTGYFVTDSDAFTRNWYKDSRNKELGPAVACPNDPLATLRQTRARCKATLGPPSPRTDDIARFNEARLGKPSNVLAADTLRQFLVRCPSLSCYESPTGALIAVYIPLFSSPVLKVAPEALLSLCQFQSCSAILKDPCATPSMHGTCAEERRPCSALLGSVG